MSVIEATEKQILYKIKNFKPKTLKNDNKKAKFKLFNIFKVFKAILASLNMIKSGLY